MLGIFNLWGRSPELKALDHELREAGLHPRTVPEAVKLTVVRLLKDEIGAGSGVGEASHHSAAQLLAYCLQGRDAFVESNGDGAADEAEDRLEAAIAVGNNLDAKLILLTLHSGVVAPDVVERFALEAG